MQRRRVFLLSPAQAGGVRARYLLRVGADFELARRLQSEGAPLGEIFAFCSGLYFRGKLAYARRFSSTAEGVFVITPSRGLQSPDTIIWPADLEEFASVDVNIANERYVNPLVDSLKVFEERTELDAVLLGSVATGKYVDLLLPFFGARLVFPNEFVGRGDMSRGGLLLRRAAEGVELTYESVASAVRRGKRPPKLLPLKKTK